ncbi:MAG: glycosyltransferase [Galactobacter sp.]
MSDSAVEEPSRVAQYNGEPSTKIVVNSVHVQTDFFRTDGSRAVSDVRDANQAGKIGGRRITIFDRSSQPVATWRSVRELQHAWFDVIFGSERAYLICDSQGAASSVGAYKRRNVVTAQVLHNTHLVSGNVTAFAALDRKKLPLVASIPFFDLFTPLTQRQKAELETAHLSSNNVRVIPNSRTLPDVDVSAPRDPGAGIMVARLSHQKHPEHAVAAAALAHGRDSRVRLDMYGDGPLRAATARVISDKSADDFVTLKGFDPAAREAFTTASFSVLSSRHEGAPLVLIEAMAAGCIPIAYDIRYGPSDVITNGVNGFVVPADDPQALADAIVKVTNLTDGELLQMRRAAQLRSRDFSDQAVLEVWGKELRRAADRKPRKINEKDPTVRTLELAVNEQGLSGRLAIEVDKRRDVEQIMLSWIPRKSTAYGRVPAQIDWTGSTTCEVSFSVPARRFLDGEQDLFDLHVDIERPGDSRRVRIVRDKKEPNFAVGRLKLYSTASGNASVDTRSS